MQRLFIFCLLATRKIVNDIYKAAAVKLAVEPLGCNTFV